MKKVKLVEEYTAKDVYDFWCNEFIKYNKMAYSARGFVGNELSLLKLALETYGIYSLLLAISSGIKSGEIAVKYFIEDINDYLLSTQYPKYVFLVRESNNLKARDLLDKLLFFESKWIPSGDDENKKRAIIDLLDGIFV